ncbi:MAG: M23 family metallopeptidase [Bacteroidota bacterium]
MGLFSKRSSTTGKRKPRWVIVGPLLVFLIGLALPQYLIIPVKDASEKDWNPETFWYYPWGKSGTHKGVDIFAREGTAVLSATYGLVLASYEGGTSGKTLIFLGPKWRIHFYAHLSTFHTEKWAIVSRGQTIGEVGDTGNAKGKPPHLHYSLMTALPYPWRMDDAPQGWKKCYVLNPIEYFP